MGYKIVVINDPGTLTEYGADDTAKFSKLLEGVDLSATDPATINTQFTFRDQKARIRDPSNTRSVILSATDGMASDVVVKFPFVSVTPDTLVTVNTLSAVLPANALTTTNTLTVSNKTLDASNVFLHKSRHVSGGTDAFVKSDILIAVARYTETLASDPSSDAGRRWINGSDMKYWDNAGTPVLQTVERQTNKGAVSGYCDLDAGQHVPLSRLFGITTTQLSSTAGITNAQIAAAAGIPYSKLTLTNTIVNADIGSAAAIAYSKLNLATSIVNADIATAAAIAYSKLTLTNSIVNADINSAAAIAYSKLNLTTSIVNTDISATAAIAYSKLALSNSILNADINSAAAIAYSKLNLSNSIVDADIAAHTSTKITITNKAHLPASGVYNDQANAYGAFDQTFRSGNVKINNPANTFAYALAGSAITGNQTLTLPLVAGPDTFVTLGLAQTLQNKTLDNTNPIQHIINSAIYTIFINGTTVKARNNLTGVIDYTADNTVDAVPCINSALANIKNLANVDAQYGGTVEIAEGVYKCVTNLDNTQPTTGRHGIKLRGHGWGSVLNFIPATALTDAISVRGTSNGIENLRIKLNANVVNAIHLKSETVWTNNEYRGSSGKIIDNVIEGADFAESPGTFAATTGQVGIFQDSPTQTVAFFWRIHDNVFRVLDTAILSTGPYTTSMFISRNVFEYCKTCIDIERSQHIITQNWLQGSPGTTMIGIRLRGTAQYNQISNITSEIMNNVTDVATVQLDNGATNNIIENVNNGYENNGSYVHSKVILDNSGNSSNYISYFSSKLSRRIVYGIQTLNKKAETGVGEIIQEWKVEDNLDTVLKVDNWATADTLFAPRILASNLHGNTSGNASKALIIESEILAAADTGTDPVAILDSRLSTGVAVVTRPLLRVANNLAAVVDFYATKIDFNSKKINNAVLETNTINASLNTITNIADTNVAAAAAIAWSKISKTGSILDDIGDVVITTPASGDVPTWNGTQWVNQQPPGATAGEANTYSNAGVGGIGVTLTKSGVNLPFKSVKANSTKIAVTDGGANNNVLIDVTEANLTLSNIGGSITSGQLVAHKASHVSGGSDAFVKADVLVASARYIEQIADPASDAGRLWVSTSDLKYWDNAGTPVKQTLERQTNKNVANGYAGLDSGSRIAKAQDVSTAVYTDQTNTFGAFLQTFGGAVALQSYADISVITIPANPAASIGRIYMKNIDANNDGFFVLKKVNGSIQEVQIA
jgi:hypothetical protein